MAARRPPEIHSLPQRHSTQYLCVCVCACMLKKKTCIFLAAVYVCAGVFSSPEQSSGNVWVTHEEMENLASSTKAVSTIWVLPYLHCHQTLPLTPSLHAHPARKIPFMKHCCTCSYKMKSFSICLSARTCVCMCVGCCTCYIVRTKIGLLKLKTKSRMCECVVVALGFCFLSL